MTRTAPPDPIDEMPVEILLKDDILGMRCAEAGLKNAVSEAPSEPANERRRAPTNLALKVLLPLFEVTVLEEGERGYWLVETSSR